MKPKAKRLNPYQHLLIKYNALLEQLKVPHVKSELRTLQAKDLPFNLIRERAIAGVQLGHCMVVVPTQEGILFEFAKQIVIEGEGA